MEIEIYCRESGSEIATIQKQEDWDKHCDTKTVKTDSNEFEVYVCPDCGAEVGSKQLDAATSEVNSLV